MLFSLMGTRISRTSGMGPGARRREYSSRGSWRRECDRRLRRGAARRLAFPAGPGRSQTIIHPSTVLHGALSLGPKLESLDYTARPYTARGAVEPSRTLPALG